MVSNPTNKIIKPCKGYLRDIGGILVFNPENATRQGRRKRRRIVFAFDEANMGVHCEINLFKPSDGAFTPGSIVSGIIKYELDTETVFNKIVMSLKGNGLLVIVDQSQNRGKKSSRTHRNSEQYVDIEHIVNYKNPGEPLPSGAYELPFSFTLPQNIPASLHYTTRNASYSIRCHIIYYVSIKFNRPGIFKFDKKMKKEITVVTGIKPRLPMEPIIYGEQKKLFKPFSKKSNIVNIKAEIANSVIHPGGKVQLAYEISNQTSLVLKGVETKLTQVYTFTAGRKFTTTEDVPETDSKSGSINSGDSSSMDLVITLPSNITSLDYSNLVSRDYFVQIKAEIPFPHLNAVLEIPLQIGDENVPSFENTDDPPPSYWEVMAEDIKEGGDDEDYDDDGGKS